MKRIIKKLLPAVVVLGFLTACEDVPAPYYLLEKITDGSIILDESFANSLGKFTVFNETEDGYEWANQYNTAYISGYQNNVNKATKSWLISPAFDLSDVDQAYVMFEYVLRYKRSTTKERILVSANYADEIIDGVHGTPLTATWYDLDINLEETADYKNFNTAGAQLPSEVLGQKRVHVALYYEAPANEASTWEVKNLVVKRGEFEDPNKPDVDAIFFSKLINDEAGFIAEPIITPDETEFQVWKNNNYGWVATGYDAEKSTDENRIYYECESWLISPAIELPDDDVYMNFMHALNYRNHEGLGVYVRVAAEEGANEFPWQELDVTWPAGNNWTFISSEDIVLNDYKGKSIQVGFKYSSTDEVAATWELENFGIYQGTPPEKPVIPVNGSGTKEDPYDVASALRLITSGAIPSSDVFVKGIVSQIDDIDLYTGARSGAGSFGNATYYISDDGYTTTQLEVYRGFGLNGDKFTSSNRINVGDEVIVVGQLVYYNNKTPEFTQGSELYMHNGVYAGGKENNYADPIGTGTQADPYNVAATVQLIDRIGNNVSDHIYTKGIISRIEEIGTGYGNATYFIKDADADGELEVFRGKGLGNADLEKNDIKEGDEVIVYGQVIYYNNRTREFTQGNYLYMLNGKTAGDTPVVEPTGSGTLEDPFNSAAANQAADKLDNGAKSPEYYIKGKVVKISQNFDTKNSNTGEYYGNATFYISDDGTAAGQFYVFRTLYLGNKKYDGNGDLLKKGDDVIICGKLTKYGTNNVLETVQNESYLYSLNGNTGGEEPPTPVEVGTYDNPWTIEDVQANYQDGKQINSYVIGYIVGYVKGSKYADGALFGNDAVETAATGSAPSNILISYTPQASSVEQCIPMALPTGVFRTGLNPKDHPELIGSAIKVYGSVEKYFQVAGLKSPSYVEYESPDATGASTTMVIGTRPDAAAKKRIYSKKIK